jgi:LytS/YehU family sensor histidine kinase
LGTFVLAAIHVVINATWLLPWMNNLAGQDLRATTTLGVEASYGLVTWVEFSAWTGIYLGYHSYRQLQDLQLRHAQEESARRAAMLESLRAQVNPHFLFNSLNTLRALITENPARARDAVSQLAQLLRASLDTTKESLIPLAQELETIACFLELEKLRYESRLHVVMDISSAAQNSLVPPFLLQTLVENAIKHGIETVPGGGAVTIHAHVEPEGLLEVRITNPGRIVAGENPGRGIQISRERLQLLGGQNASLVLEQTPGNEVIATLRFPQPKRI